MHAVEMMKHMCAATGTAFLLGKAVAAKDLGLPIWAVLSIDQLGQIDTAFIDAVRGDDGL